MHILIIYTTLLFCSVFLNQLPAVCTTLVWSCPVYMLKNTENFMNKYPCDVDIQCLYINIILLAEYVYIHIYKNRSWAGVYPFHSICIHSMYIYVSMNPCRWWFACVLECLSQFISYDEFLSISLNLILKK